MRRFGILLCLNFFLWHHAHAQDSIYIVTNYNNQLNEYLSDFNTTFATIQEAEHALNDLVHTMQIDGYLTAAWRWEPNEMHGNPSVKVVEINLGKKVLWANLDASGVEPWLLRAAGFDPEDWINTTYNQNKAASFLQELVSYANNNGYPFASSHLDSITYIDSTLSAKVIFEKNILIFFDTIKVIGSLQVTSNFITQYTQIISGQPYDQSLIDALPSRLKELNFLQQTKAPQIEFMGNKATVLIFADDKRSGSFDFLLGVLPNNEITGRLIITGDMRLHLQNVFHSGEEIHFQYTKLESASKSMDAAFTYPYLPHMPLGPDASFHLYLKDSTFLERKASAGVVWQIAGNHSLKGFASFYNSSVLRPDTTFVLLNYALPSMLDVKENAYGLTWQYQHLDYTFNPRKGYAIALTGTAGTRTILENVSITELFNPLTPDFDFSTLYDSIENKSLSLKYQYDLQYFIPLYNRMAILLQVRGASILHDNIVENELYRIGGNQLLRGFDEQSLPVSDYHIGTFEYRYLLSQNAYTSVFVDAGVTKNNALDNTALVYPYGFGAGVRFETKAGIFGLSYALGGSNMNPVQVKNTKVHFGYINYF